MSVPFSPARVSRFLLLFCLALAAVWGLYIMLTHVRARQSITPQHAQLQPLGLLPRLSAASLRGTGENV